jgi:class 3 adenylate cyclase
MGTVRRVIVRHVKSGRPRPQSGIVQQAGVKLIDNEIIKEFNPAMLELGDLNIPCEEKESIAAVFDLTGFTAFCNQVDSYLAIPRFLNDFLEWFFTNVRKRITDFNYGDRSALWAGLPMMVKFLGDGLLLLWDSRKMSDEQICRLAATLYEICHAYKTEFYPHMMMVVDKPPVALRCGVARGRVFTIGDNKDFVGHCINTASRLSALGSLTFSFPHRGFRVMEHMPPQYRRLFIPKYASIRGVGENELVWVVKEEFDRLTEKNREMFRNPVPVGKQAG